MWEIDLPRLLDYDPWGVPLMKYRAIRWLIAAVLLVSFVRFSSTSAQRRGPSLDDILGLTQPAVAITASFFHLPSLSQLFLVSNSAKYVSCEYTILGYTVAITTGCRPESIQAQLVPAR
jgi:hypothetical protein